MDVLKVIFEDVFFSSAQREKMGHFWYVLTIFKRKAVRANTPTAPRWKAHIEICQKVRQKG